VGIETTALVSATPADLENNALLEHTELTAATHASNAEIGNAQLLV
jgi:hypothetical protein